VPPATARSRNRAAPGGDNNVMNCQITGNVLVQAANNAVNNNQFVHSGSAAINSLKLTMPTDRWS